MKASTGARFVVTETRGERVCFCDQYSELAYTHTYPIIHTHTHVHQAHTHTHGSSVTSCLWVFVRMAVGIIKFIC